jgi:choline dehydrogenase-like flavoprotein
MLGTRTDRRRRDRRLESETPPLMAAGQKGRMSSNTAPQADCEYVVVGSGAGGGTVASRLAEAGRTVVLLEAGADPRELAGGDPVDPGGNRLPEDYDVPVFHAFASENDAMSWNFFVRHYASDERQRRDPKYRETWDGRPVDGVLYPRAGTLGGCTAHNAMIMVYPHNADWDAIAELTGDRSWDARHMRAYFQRLENCRHRAPYRWLSWIGLNPTRHGWKGWLSTEKSIPDAALDDRALMKVIRETVREAFDAVGQPIERLRWLFQSQLDPNDWRVAKDNAVGTRYMPLTTHNHARVGARERVLETARRYPDRLKVELHALATRVLFDDGNRALGVEYLSGPRLYRAHRYPSHDVGERRRVRASREVILAGGAFNTPQLLMLSGVGPAEALQYHGIPARVDLPGVGRNLQDRYEVSVVNRMNFDRWDMLEGATFAKGDPQYQQWSQGRKGLYTTNGGVLGVIKRSASTRPLPDLFCLALLGPFQGYFPGYSTSLAKNHNYFTWTILKAHTQNRAGEVTLRSADPCDTPAITFRYFEEGSDTKGEDLESVVDAIKFVRRLTARLRGHERIAEEEVPGEHVQSDDQLRDFVRDHAWGHHASCTCAIGPKEQNGVLSADFGVHGTEGLRVVDASVFPRIPGFFIASAVYMIGEKAADVILADAARTAPGSAGHQRRESTWRTMSRSS